MGARDTGGARNSSCSNEKRRVVEAVFESIAGSYDLMNDLISLGSHRIAKRRTVAACVSAPGDRVLDLGGGTGDVALRCGETTRAKLVILADRSREMLRIARRRIARSGAGSRVACVAADALALPFGDETFGCILVSFGLRNFADIASALAAAGRVLRPGGALVVLDFSTPRNRLVRAAFRLYLDRVVPVAADLLTGEGESYRYLASSVRSHPGAPELREMMVRAGFHDCSYRTMFGGVLALHRGRKAGGALRTGGAV